MSRFRLRSLLDVSLLSLALISPAAAQDAVSVPDYVLEEFGAPPAIPTGDLSPELADAVHIVFVDSVEQSLWGAPQQEALQIVAASGDPRLAWIISDMMRFTWRASFDDALAEAAAGLLGIEYTQPRRWDEVTNHLIAWDIPAYPGYLPHKRAIFTHFVPGWEEIFVEGDIDWRMVSWGGVLIDDRPFGTTEEPCNCIPAADNPEVETAEEAT
ncbi:MAG: hypothetical protein AAGL89_12435, partial [Pseudomonadota bacterium]